MIERACAFTGHRKLPNNTDFLITKILDEIRTLVKSGITFFLNGGALGFDMLAAYAVLSLKNEYPALRLIMVLPCRDQDKYWNETEKLRYAQILRNADQVIYTSERYDFQCMHLRNRYLIDHSSVCLCYQTSNTGGTAYTVNYARKNGKRIINLAQNEPEQFSLF